MLVKITDYLAGDEHQTRDTTDRLSEVTLTLALTPAGKMVILPAGADHTASMLRVPIDVQHYSHREEIVKNRRFAKTISAERSAWLLTP